MEEPMPTPTENDRRDLWRRAAGVIAQALSREALVIILREVWRQGPWS
jgi:hypothetical protein